MTQPYPPTRQRPAVLNGTARRLRNALFAIAAGLMVTTAAVAQSWPQKPVSVIVPFPAGGSSDTIARMLAPPLNEKLGQPFVIENKPGATGSIGAAMVKRAPADGYTMLVAPISVYAINPFLHKNLPYDPAKDFDLLTVAVRAPNVLVAHPSFPANTVAELIAHLKKNPGKVSFASSGAGSSDHLTAALFWQKTGTQGLHVPYKGGAPAVSDLLAGQTNVSFQNINAIVQHVKAGKLKALAVTGEKRSDLLANVPTLAEAGVKDVEVYSWQAVAAPRGLPKDVKSKLHGALVASLNDPQMRAKLAESGFEVVANTPEEFTKFENQELQRWKTVIETGNITAE
ncbi:tripartite tricarboxylate transporter substrate binding protein [Cupriavidus respiraculi]|uniref:Tripartite tricarboxylate transporter substrate binding protein n=2 Tax=Cupriavidus respiraculi TaxID=195930 RepID=A0ABM8X1X1_9BURK|nr:hypothetical protein LMG21510_02381 [Cupriavidus respiraculi]